MLRQIAPTLVMGLILASPCSSALTGASASENRFEFWASFPAADAESEPVLIRFRDEILFAAGLEGGLEELELGADLARSELFVLGIQINQQADFALALRNPFQPSGKGDRWHRDGEFVVWTSANFPPSFRADLIEKARAEPVRSGRFLIRMSRGWMGLPGSEGNQVVKLPGGSLSEALASMETLQVEGTIDQRVDMSMFTSFPESSQAAIVADAWNSVLTGFRGNSGGAQQIVQSLAAAQVFRNGRHLEIRLPLTREALQRLHHAQASRQFLLWNQLGYEREASERCSELFEALGVQPGARLADLGAGQGFYTLRLARAVGTQGRVFAIDVNAAVLELLRERVKSAELEQVEVIQGEPDDPKLDGRELDAVLIVNTYHEIGDYEAVLAHLKKSIRPGGKLVLLEPYSPEREGLSRSEQTEAHQIAPQLVSAELERAGFKILMIDRKFTDNTHEDHTHHNGLVVAVRP